MNITITGRKVNLRDSFKERVEKKLAKFDRLFNEDAQANVTVTLEKNRQTVEVTIRHEGMVFRAEETSAEMEEALDRVMDALSRQIRKNKTRLAKKLYAPSIDALAAGSEEEEEIRILRTKHFTVKPLDAEEAVLQMNMLGHSFFMFRNAQTGEINVVYRRKNGDYGLLEPDVN